jgi:outer membrane protein OmpA-like peptidoglycan-associated protein
LTSSADPNASGGGDQLNFTVIKAEFLPGEKTVFFDDFSDMAGDDAPPHWKIRGATPELRVAGSTRELALIGDRYDIYPNITGLPKNFTMEMDMLCEEQKAGIVDGCGSVNYYFHSKSGREEWLFKIWIGMDRVTEDKKAVEWRIGLWDAKEALGQKTLITEWNKPVKVAMWVQNGRVRFYINGDRIFDFNQVEVGEIASLDMNFWTGDKTMAIRRVRFAESSPDFSQTITSSGKFVTHGILFDTDSDHVKPESAVVIQSIAKGLMQATDLNFEIDGHTDATGNAAHNMDLSKRRAEAVKDILVSQFSIDASRLTTAGFGSSKPIDSNSTPEGKANNRRVEFVRK